MKTSKREQKKRAFFDIRNEESKNWWFDWINSKRTLNLRKKFYERKPIVALLFVFLISSGIFVLRSALTKAEAADFYPNTCLGTWQNPQNAQGVPETFSSATIFDENNSAVFASGSERIFCGSFVPPDYETEGSITNAGLTLVWDFVGVSSSLSITEPIIEETSTATSSSPSESNPNLLPDASSTQENSSGTSLYFNKNKLSLLDLFFNKVYAEGELMVDTTTIQVVSVDDNKDITSSTVQESLDLNSNVATGSVSEIENSSQATSSFDETSIFLETVNLGEASTTEASTTVIIASPIIAPLEPISSSSEPILNGTDATISSIVAPVTVLELIEPVIDENFILISYSFDGQEWIELKKANQDNWQNLTVTLPVKSWDELKKIQISIENIPTSLSQIPQIYLDGMFLEAHYELSPELVVGGGVVLESDDSNGVDLSEADQLIESNLSSSSVSQLATKPLPRVSIKSDGFNLESEQTDFILDPKALYGCRIEPFSQIIKKNNPAHYLVNLKQSNKETPFRITLGDLPLGVVASFSSSGFEESGAVSLDFSLGDNASQGSYNIVAVYEELGKDGLVSSNMCQLNLIID
ncbi:MAG: hypothetical protein QMD50_00410 [Patescibacteria group bacterium]|nr:hypothetical protein [Patescibacteria group bacterium]